jgi:hypothetical protein
VVFGLVVVRAPAVGVAGAAVLDVDRVFIVSISACHRIDPFSM